MKEIEGYINKIHLRKTVMERISTKECVVPVEPPTTPYPKWYSIHTSKLFNDSLLGSSWSGFPFINVFVQTFCQCEENNTSITFSGNITIETTNPLCLYLCVIPSEFWLNVGNFKYAVYEPTQTDLFDHVCKLRIQWIFSKNNAHERILRGHRSLRTTTCIILRELLPRNKTDLQDLWSLDKQFPKPPLSPGNALQCSPWAKQPCRALRIIIF